MHNQSLRAVLRYFQSLGDRDSIPPADHDLLSDLVSRRDEQALVTLMQRHGPMVLSVCRRVLHNEDDAEDAFQATFLVLVKKANTIQRGESLHSYLYRVAFRLAQRLRWQIARRKAEALSEEAICVRAEPDALSWQEVRSALDEELQQLPERYRAPLVLCCLSGKTRDEAAEELGWTLNVLKGRLERGRNLLRTRLLRRGVELSSALLALTLSQSKSAAALPAQLTVATLKVAASASGSAAGTVPAQVLQLAEFGARATGLGPLKLSVLASLVLSFAVLGAAVVWTTVFPAPAVQAPSPGTAGQESRVVNQTVVAGPRPDGSFVDVTRESGLQEIVAAKYAATPTWWLSGLHLLDLDGDGHLDFFMSAPDSAKAAPLPPSTTARAISSGPRGATLRPSCAWPTISMRMARLI